MLKKIQLAVYDTSEYMSALAEMLCRTRNLIFDTRLYTKQEALLSAINRCDIDILLIEEYEEVSGDISNSLRNVKQTVLISEEEGSGDSGNRRIFKYQQTSDIIRELLEIISENDQLTYTQKKSSKRAVEIVGVYSPFGGRVTDVAIETMRDLSDSKKVIFVSLELFNNMQLGSQGRRSQFKKECRGMSEILFYLRQKKEKVLLKIESLIVHGKECDYINTVEDYRDLYNMSVQDMEKFLQVLTDETGYEVIVFDIGFLADSTILLMERCDKLYFLKPLSEYQQGMMNSFKELLFREKKGELFDRASEIEI